MGNTQTSSAGVFPAGISNREYGLPELEGEDGIPSRAKILKIAKQDMLKTSRLIYRWLHDR